MKKVKLRKKNTLGTSGEISVARRNTCAALRLLQCR
jgi:hypothetical protein